MNREPPLPNWHDRILGSLFGGAIGDALGGPYEGQPPPVTVHVQPESWSLSDDTQLTLATCEAILEAGRPDPETIAATFVQWFNQGRITGIGASTLKAMLESVGSDIARLAVQP